eukprot:scaffold1035_cov63-Phaeocystis_antarctica.AAC.2
MSARSSKQTKAESVDRTWLAKAMTGPARLIRAGNSRVNMRDRGSEALPESPLGNRGEAAAAGGEAAIGGGSRDMQSVRRDEIDR